MALLMATLLVVSTLMWVAGQHDGNGVLQTIAGSERSHHEEKLAQPMAHKRVQVVQPTSP